MEVDNYAQGYNSDWTWGYYRQPGKISRRAYDKILKEAKEIYLSGFGINWSEYDEGKLTFDDMTTCQAEFTNKISGQQIHLTHIWFNHKTGVINQAGTQHGSLTL